MRNYKTRPSSVKLTTVKTLKRQLFVLVGVFLMAIIFIPANASAGIEFESGNKVEFNTNKKSFTSIKETLGIKKDIIKEREVQVAEVKEEAKRVVEAKVALVSEVEAVKQEVQALQAKVDEKNRRTVQIGGYAPNAGGNTYVSGNCTWYAKSRRPDLPNRMGNAKHWYASAQRAGFKVGTESRKGAIGVNFSGGMGHVVYVEEWYANGTVLVSEMNFVGLGKKSTRLTSESEFKYIYEKA